MTESDAQLVLRARGGDAEAFAALVRRYERPILAVVYRLLRSWHDARDVAQEAFAIAYEKLNRLWRPARFGPWLMRIARRVALQELKRRERLGQSLDDVAMAASVPCKDTVTDVSLDLLSLIARLPVQERIVVGLRHLDGLDVASIARATGRPLGTVTKQLSRAYARLRRWLDTEVDNG